MTIGLLFWIIFIVAAILGTWGWSTPQSPAFSRWGGGLLIFVLLGLLGWKVFGKG